MKRTPPFWASLFTMLAVLVLCGLGTWQIERLHWKQDILQKLDEAYAAQGQAAPLRPDSLGGRDFAYGSAEGIFLPGKALLLGPRTRNGQIGNDLIVPLETVDGTLLVNMGWTDDALADLPIHHLEGERVRFEGLARRPSWNAFTPENDPAVERWHKPDIEEIAAALSLVNPWPYMLYAERASYKFDAAFPNNERWAPPDDHLQYAVFWFTMAGALVLIYALRFLRTR